MVKDFLNTIPPEVLAMSRDLDLCIDSKNAHKAIYSALDKTVLSGGKRLRPMLTFLMGHLFFVDLKTLIPFARATELVHAASLSHDDVIDNATLRRGHPSINIVESNKKAVLAGDYLLSQVIVDLCSTNELELVSKMSKVIMDLSVGEWEQLDLIESKDYTKEKITSVAAKKTSSVMSYCTFAPAFKAQAPKSILDASEALGYHLGLAFQLIDDTLDYAATSDKDLFLDLKNGVVNSVVFDAFSTHPQFFNRFQNGECLFDIFSEFHFNFHVENIKSEALIHLEKANEKLDLIEKYLLETQGIDSKNEVQSRTDFIRMMMSFIALRKN